MHDDAATPARPKGAEPTPAASPGRDATAHGPDRGGPDEPGGPGPQIEDLLVSGLDRYFAGRHE